MEWVVYFLPHFLIITLALTAYLLKKLTWRAAIAGIMVAFLIMTCAGNAGLLMLAVFFILGTAATSFKKREKNLFKPAADRTDRRNCWQVFANGGVAALCVLAFCLFPRQLHYYQNYLLPVLMVAASLAAATADTLSSELGMVYGRSFFNIINLKPDEKGLDGVISLEGTLIGISGSSIIALIYSLYFGFTIDGIIIIIAGTIGNLADSLLGVTLERKGYIGNNTVNFLNTLIGALAALLLHFLLG